MNSTTIDPYLSHRHFIYIRLEEIKREIANKETVLKKDRWYKLALYRVEHHQATHDDIAIVQRHRWIEKEIVELKNQYQQLCLRGVM